MPTGADAIAPVKPKTIAKSLSIGNPADGWYALDVIRRTGGSCASVTDDEIIEGIRLLARTEGIFAETAGGVTIATLAKLAATGEVRRDERVVALVTGHGLKTVEALSGTVGPTASIERDPGRLRRRPRRRAGGRVARVSVTVRVPTQLRTLTGGLGEVPVDGSTVGEALKALDAAHPGMAERLFDDGGPPAPVRERVRGRRGRAVPRRPGHPGRARPDRLDRPGGGRGLSPGAVARAAPRWFPVSTRQTRVLTNRYTGDQSSPADGAGGAVDQRRTRPPCPR